MYPSPTDNNPLNRNFDEGGLFHITCTDCNLDELADRSYELKEEVKSHIDSTGHRNLSINNLLAGDFTYNGNFHIVCTDCTFKETADGVHEMKSMVRSHILPTGHLKLSITEL